MSLDKWEDNSRINRRLKDLQAIFEFNGDNKSSNHPFRVTPTGLQQIIDRQKIKSYFDFKCGDGTITAGIGAYLGLIKEKIFGGDVYEVQNNAITFVKVNENQSTINLPSNHVDLITSFVTFHHISQIKQTLTELVRILRPGGYLILGEHDCKNEYSLSAKYLNFVHAIMMIARVGEFADSPNDHDRKNQHVLNNDYEDDTDSWTKQKSRIIEYIKSIYYRTCDELQQQFESVGFHLCATFYYGFDGSTSNHVDLITSFVTFHHISQIKQTLTELVRILRPGGYLILREHDCKKEYSLSAKYLNFVHAIMMIARVGEFAHSSNDHDSKNQHVLSNDYENDTDSWTKQKSRIIEYIESICYRTCDELQQQLESVGFHLCATFYYGVDGSSNPQKLFYAVYQLDRK
ncbi:unnamed protein product [Rotaria sp. Silwood1]|nr:unnamed protein product [Rotaria sp. Silwood1]